MRVQRLGIDGIEQEIEQQRAFVSDRNPAYERLLGLALSELEHGLGDLLEEAWAKRSFAAFYERPLLLLAAIRYDALCEGPSHPLYAAIAGEPPDPEAASAAALRAATDKQRARFFRALCTRAIQTNETSRAVTWLWPASLLARAGVQQPIALCDLGTSAGLNLGADALPSPWIDADGRSLAVQPRPPVALRLGFDIAPLDARDSDTAQWLRACVWPGESARLQRLEQAIAAFTALAESDQAPELRRCALPDAPAQLSGLPADCCALALQTIVRDYLAPDVFQRYDAAMHAWLRERPALRALWSQLELIKDAPSAEQVAGITVRFVDRSGSLRELLLARTHPHPHKLFIQPAAVAELIEAFA